MESAPCYKKLKFGKQQLMDMFLKKEQYEAPEVTPVEMAVEICNTTSSIVEGEEVGWM